MLVMKSMVFKIFKANFENFPRIFDKRNTIIRVKNVVININASADEKHA